MRSTPWKCLILLCCIAGFVAPASAGLVPSLDWTGSLGGANYDDAMAIQQTHDGGLIVVGSVLSTDHDGTGNHGGYDIVVAKLSRGGTREWVRVLGGSGNEKAYAVKSTSYGGYLVGGFTKSFQSGDVGQTRVTSKYADAWIVNLSSTGQIVWNVTFSGNLADEVYALRQTADGGYLAAGMTTSTNAFFFNGSSLYLPSTGLHGPSPGASHDVLLVKVSRDGALEWQKCLGGNDFDVATSIEATNDGGSILAGITKSNNTGDIGPTHNTWPLGLGPGDIWVAKLTGTGGIVWSRSLGGTATEDGTPAVQQTSDGGYIVVGKTWSNDGDVAGFHGLTDAWAVKLTPSGAIAWQRCLGGTGAEQAIAVRQTADGGYLVAGQSTSNDGDVRGVRGGYDAWFVKLDANGRMTGQRPVGGTKTDIAQALAPLNDGGYVFAGTSSSADGDLASNFGLDDLVIGRVSIIESGPTASFAAYPQSGPAPLSVRFLDYSYDGPVAWSWDFGDGGVSDQQYPAHVYNRSGLYTVSLTVTDSGGRTGTATRDHYIRVADMPTPSPTPLANFSANATTGPAPLAVAFTDASSPAPYHRWWQFGDGTSSTDADPVHIYTTPGTRTVNLTVWTALGIASKTGTVTVGTDSRAPVANFTMSRTSGHAPLYVKFTDASTGAPTSWRWDFGGLAWTALRNPSVIFRQPGTCAVTLTVRNAYGSSSMTKNLTVVATPGRSRAATDAPIQVVG
jgi:PKD repeat protein